MSEISPAPGTRQTSTKATIAAVGGFLTAFLTTLLQVWTDTDPLSSRDVVVALSAGIASSLGLYGLVYSIPNKAKP